MKLLHTGDLHLGRSLGEYDLTEDQRYILNQILKIAERESVDAVLLAGDIYDRAVPSEAATRLLDEFLQELADRGVPVLIISGNHDSDDRLNFGSRFFERSGIYIASVFDGTLYKKSFEDEYGEVCIYLLPFVKASRVKHFYPEEKIESYDDAVRVILSHAEIDPVKRNVIVAHQFVAGRGEDPLASGSEGPSVVSVGLVEKIGYDCFDAFDYAALGHIHSPQSVGREAVRYAGSILKYSVSEAGSAKSVTVVELKEKGEAVINRIPLVPLRDVRHIKGPVEKLLARENITAPEDFIYVTLTDEESLNDAMGIFRQTYPNMVKLDYDNSHTREIQEADYAKIGDHKSFAELIRDFYRQMYGCGMSEEEMAVMLEAAGEAGVIHEAG